MEFLQARQFNKEEIFALFAPGLASVLDVNATEANAEAGRKTLADSIYADMAAISSAITHTLLPTYGENLVAEFDDIRITDRQIVLQEQQVYAQSHTVDEIRAQYYGDDPIGDARGKLLPAEVAKMLLGPTETESEPPRTENEIEEKRKAELTTWRRYAVKHGAIKAARFSPNEQEVKAAFVGPF